MNWFHRLWYRYVDYPILKQRRNKLDSYYAGVADGIKWAKECIDGDVSLAGYISPRLTEAQAHELAKWLRQAAIDVEIQGRS